MKNKKVNLKKQRKIVEEAARRLAEIFIMQLEEEKGKRKEKTSMVNSNRKK